MKRDGIDLSHWNGYVDFNEVAKAGYDFAILKCGGSDAGFYRDSKFEENYYKAKAAGIYVGSYYFVGSKCISKEDGEADAERFINLVKGKKFEYPLYLDFEAPPARTKAGNTEAAIAFCDRLEKAGYYAAIYASDISGFKERLNLEDLRRFDKWVARYGSAPSYVKNYGMWQYSSTGKVPGIDGNVDLNISYYDFPDIMKRHHLNGY